MVVPFGADDDCALCDDSMTWHPPGTEVWVVANVYEGRGEQRHWDRVEKWHPKCYDSKGRPYGEAPYRKAQISKSTSW